MSVLAASITAGILEQVSCRFAKQFILLWFVISITNANVPDILPGPLVAPATSAMPLPAKLPLHQSHHRKYMSPQSAPIAGLAPASSPYYGPLITSGHPPISSSFSKPLMKSGSAPPGGSLENIAPIQSSAGAIPSGLPQPPLSPNAADCCKPDMVQKRGSGDDCHCVYPLKIDLLLLNVSQNPNWKLFLEELASELRLQVSQIELINFYVLSLSRLNISMDITPHSGISFSAVDVTAINSSLIMHKVRLDPTQVGDYSLLNITWFKPPPPSEAPLASASPVEAPAYHFPASTSLSSPSKGHHSNLTLLGIGAGFLFLAILFVLIICLCKSHRGKTAEAPPLVPEKSRVTDKAPGVGSFSHPSSMRFLTYEELKEATHNFEAASILGEGGFGRVYKGVLSDGTAVAIKRLSSGGQQGDKEFLVEVEMLSRLHHRNLIKLVGYYCNRDSSQNLLCYELVPNGSLEAWLHGPLGVNCPLDWDTRMKIALDAARGLAYLHEDSQPCVIHRDFKASNILLENNFHAKVADFGLAKQAPEGRANYLSTRVMGTFGYVAPEYAMTGHLLIKSDVYSYGVVLLELLTGRKPVDMSQPSGQENLVTWARPILRDKERLEELPDPRLGGKYPKEDFVRVCTIAAACVAPEAGQRPTMGEVVQSLKMVQRVTEYQDSMAVPSSNNRTNLRQSSTTFESDGSSSVFSSGPYSGLSTFDNDNVSRTAIFSEDLHEGR
ncbi:receptor-like serine/threonine-protein kinase ALE2 isoform X2 [Cucurbita moschata]|uniref:Receptor-like serine/threonine-protein kinase ALE2 isoform X2 n=1 Tax=Cucurbita moschata TaxID=3662 RepID=A0A6J1F312_CUCMO|nr:receptor-like serine/threonine-protein kinase ALE2 isoform X2 [Cucurbita moschata]